MASRFVLGPAVQVDEMAVPPVPQPPGLTVDSTLTIIATHPGGSITVAIDTHDPAKVNSPIAVHAVYCPVASYPTDPTKVVPAFFLSGGFAQAFVNTTGFTNQQFDVQVPNVTPGTYVIQTILEFAS